MGVSAKELNDEILKNNCVEYGNQIVSTAMGQLSWTHFKGYRDEQII